MFVRFCGVVLSKQLSGCSLLIHVYQASTIRLKGGYELWTQTVLASERDVKARMKTESFMGLLLLTVRVAVDGQRHCNTGGKVGESDSTVMVYPTIPNGFVQPLAHFTRSSLNCTVVSWTCPGFNSTWIGALSCFTSGQIQRHLQPVARLCFARQKVSK